MYCQSQDEDQAHCQHTVACVMTKCHDCHNTLNQAKKKNEDPILQKVFLLAITDWKTTKSLPNPDFIHGEICDPLQSSPAVTDWIGLNA